MNYEKSNKWYRIMDGMGWMLFALDAILSVFFKKDYYALFSLVVALYPLSRLYKPALNQVKGVAANYIFAGVMLSSAAYDTGNLIHVTKTWITITDDSLSIAAGLLWGVCCLIAISYTRSKKEEGSR